MPPCRPLPFFAAGLFVVIGLNLTASRLVADPVAELPSPTLPVSDPVMHLTDAQNRVGSGKLNPTAQALSEANALYAETLSTNPETHPADALEKFRIITKLDPHYLEAQVWVANLLIQTGQVESALNQLQQALEINPGAPTLESALAYARKLRGENEEAMRLSTLALTKDPTLITSMRVQLEIASERNDLARGIIRIEEMLRLHGREVPSSVWLNLGRIYVDVARGGIHTPTGDVILNTLLPIYRQAAEIMPVEVSTLTLLSDTYRDLGRKKEALATLRKASALEPSNVDIILRCADLEINLGESAAALKDYAIAYQLNSNLTGLRQLLIHSYIGSKRYHEAIHLLLEALMDSPNDPNTEIELGIAYQGDHQRDKAEDAFSKAFDSPLCTPDTFLKLAVYQLENKQIKNAGQTLTQARKRFPKSAKVEFYTAIQYRTAKKYPEALASLAQVRNLAVGSEATVLDVNYYLEAGLTMDVAGHKESVESTLHEGLSKFPDNPDLMNELAYFWAEAGTHLDEALVLSRRAATLAPDNGPILDTLGWTLVCLDQSKEASLYLQRAVVLTNNDPVVLQHLGDAYFKLGRKRDAIGIWRRALDQDPGNHSLTKKIHDAEAQAPHAHHHAAP